jgi:energy-coupling factor transporter ATP-binding protein EcfA2
MINPTQEFPNASPQLLSTIEESPKTLMGVNNAIDFKDSLQADDPRYVETAKARDEAFEKRFFRTFGYDTTSNNFEPPPRMGKHVLFFGHVGCGKSTELARLSKVLHNPNRYWVVNVDLLSLLDPSNVNYSDVWLAVAQQLVSQLESCNIRIDPQISSRLANWFIERVLSNEQIKEFSAEIKAGIEAGVGIPYLSKLFAKFTAAIKTGSTHREIIRTVVRNTYGEFIAALNLLFSAAVDGVIEAQLGRQLLIVIDGPDRFRGDDWRKFFVDESNQLTQASCVVVYTAPMALKSCGARLDTFDSLVLPMIKLREFDTNAKRLDAFNTMRQVILKRAHHSLFDSMATVDSLIEYSGGHLRDSLRLLSFACVEADATPLTSADIDAAALRLAGDYRSWLEQGESYKILAQAEAQPYNEGCSPTITKLVEGGALLEYNNGSWRHPHPVVRLLHGYIRAVQALVVLPIVSPTP